MDILLILNHSGKNQLTFEQGAGFQKKRCKTLQTDCVGHEY